MLLRIILCIIICMQSIGIFMNAFVDCNLLRLLAWGFAFLGTCILGSDILTENASKSNRNKPILYALHPGWVESLIDGDRHYVGSDKLIKLYNLNIKDCIEWNDVECKSLNWKDYIHLFPQSKAENYNLDK